MIVEYNYSLLTTIDIAAHNIFVLRIGFPNLKVYQWICSHLANLRLSTGDPYAFGG